MLPRAEGWSWLGSTYQLQSETYGYPLSTFAALAEGRQMMGMGELCKYLDWNVTAAGQELAELRVEFHWKPWAADRPFVNRDRILRETVDVMHFLGNILVGLGVTQEEFEQAYQEKQAINRARQASGNYSAKKGGIGEGSD